jgi:4-diphosphocytidyl-2-C-methyl-D-erythritol kinase
MKSLTVKSPAKLNLILKVLRKRPDGYHDLATLFHRISVADTLILKKRASGFELKCSEKSLPTDERNLVTKAYHLLKQEIPELGGVSVTLKKVIPMGAGLGGGSSNAAFFLLGMKKLYRLRVSQAKLLKLGAKLGADIPFFIHNYRQALGIGRGDKLKNRPTKAKHIFILAASEEGLSTRDVYESLPVRHEPLSLTKVSRAITMLCAFLETKNYGQADGLLQNDLEISAFKLRPSLHAVLEQFQKRGIRPVRMTGSGPTIFGILPHLREAKRVKKALQRDLPDHKVLICHSY